jgi:hypothetical protein
MSGFLLDTTFPLRRFGLVLNPNWQHDFKRKSLRNFT